MDFEQSSSFIAGAVATCLLGWFVKRKNEKSPVQQQSLPPMEPFNSSEQPTALQQAAIVFEQAREGIMLLDSTGQILQVNQAFCQATGFESTEVLGKSHTQLHATKSKMDEFLHNVQEKLAGKDFWEGEIWYQRKSGEIFPEWLSVSVVKSREQETQSYVCIFEDLTAQKLTEQKIHRLAYYDSLTDLPNKTLFLERVGQCIAHAKRHRHSIVVMYLDLERFKNINESLGISVGDETIKKIGQEILQCVRENDTVARIDSDEFAILISHENPAEEAMNVARAVAAKIFLSIGQSRNIVGHDLSFEAAIGIACYPNDGDKPELLLRNAATAMHHARQQGSNQYQFYTAEMNQAALERFMLENNLRKAVRKKEFKLSYQPKFDLANAQVVGLETLLRWQHPVEGMISPAEFMPLANESGLIIDIGKWVLHEITIQIKDWLEQNVAFNRISINISARQFKDDKFIPSLRDALHYADIEGKHLALEFTEAVLLENVEKTVLLLNQLRALGIYISVDDFGTGYSSLSYLKKFPIDSLKIDKGFIKDITTSKDHAEIVSAVIAIGHSLNLKVVAEGVETAKQLEFIQTKGCDYAQGFYYSAPLSAEDMTRYLSEVQIQASSRS